jgi:hypothetical protein
MCSDVATVGLSDSEGIVVMNHDQERHSRDSVAYQKFKFGTCLIYVTNGSGKLGEQV